MHWLVRSSSFSKAQGLRETGSCCIFDFLLIYFLDYRINNKNNTNNNNDDSNKNNDDFMHGQHAHIECVVIRCNSCRTSTYLENRQHVIAVRSGRCKVTLHSYG